VAGCGRIWLGDRRKGAAGVTSLVAKDKGSDGVIVGVAISFPVTFGFGIPYVYWLLTGRGPWRRYGFSSAVVVNPFPRRMPAEMGVALARLHEERVSEACPIASRARH
jgi:hypothetical protein